MVWVYFILAIISSVVADCPPGSIYDSYFNKCYLFVSTPMTFLDAEDYCNSFGGHLAEEQNAFESSYVADVARGGGSKSPVFWIGANVLRSSTWSWTSNAVMGYTNWALGQPDNTYPCAYVKESEATWSTLSCNKALRFMCTISPNATRQGLCPTQPPIATTAPLQCSLDSYCDNGYILHWGTCTCYRYYQDYLYFLQANGTCASEGAMLAKIPSQEVNDFLTALPGFQTIGPDCPYFGIYCSGNTQRSCTWVDGTPIGNYTNFNHPDYSYHYFTLVADTFHRTDQVGKWENDNSEHAFLCQKAPSTQPRLMDMASGSAIPKKGH